ncbi:sensor domain-containing protein [Streptomyces sp. Pv4-95]|uniref:sensor histidine kinase n=1 Tax=Streptomyces sp. Pv4-95 TaxID=3049543 RepID=UPI0038922DC8
MADRERGPARRLRPAVRPGDIAYAVVGLPLAIIGCGYVLAALYAGTLLSLTVLGLPLAAVAVRGARGLGELHRRLAGRLLGEAVEKPAPLPAAQGVIARARVLLTDPVGWRAMLYLGLRLPVGVLTFAVAVVLPLACGWLIAFPLWLRILAPDESPEWWLSATGALLGIATLLVNPAVIRGMARLNRYLARLLLGPAGTQQRLQALERARSTLVAESTENLRRLERDLHDGTQAELVAIAITLSLADDAFTTGDSADLDRLRTLVTRARGQTDDAIVSLRRLTRGIHPVGLDAGLGDALPTLTDAGPVPVATRLELRERPDPAIERAVYFCLAELLTNMTKHSGADAAAVEILAERGRVRMVVSDNGRGGARLGGGSGLTGLRERLAAVDGTLRIVSPAGGPTTVTAELPSRI